MNLHLSGRDAAGSKNVYPARDEPERVVLPVASGVQPSSKPPVRIYLGTEPAQYRAERVFIWSVACHRDPSRVYEIYLMKRLAGFDDRRWLTGFTNYRFAIPHFAGARGRAIYNDTDQAYLDDPGKLFDLEMNDHAYLAIAPRDTSVMLIDCAKMAALWSLKSAQNWRKNRLIDHALGDRTAYGKLDGCWNARDEEYVAGTSKLVHFTTIHKQPWRPFPERYVYQPNPLEDLFFELEDAANAAGFNVFDAAKPSQYWPLARQRVERASAMPACNGDARDELRDLLSRAQAASLLHVRDGNSHLKATTVAEHDGVLAHEIGLMKALANGIGEERFDGVFCDAALEDLPLDDVPWVIDKLFDHAARFVYLVVRSNEQARALKPHQGTVQSICWWAKLLEIAARRRPQIHWTVVSMPAGDLANAKLRFRRGGAFLGDSTPSVWLLEDHKPGHTTQSLGLANALGWPFQRIKLTFGPLAARPNFLLGPTLRGLSQECAAQFKAPWPDLVIASGARAAPVAEWIRAQSKGRTRTVVLGRKGAHLGNDFDLAVTPAYVGLYPDPRRIETTAPLTRIRQRELDEAGAHWQSVLGEARSPRIALLVGGDDSVHALDAEQARRMGGEVGNLARDAGGSVFVTTSRRTDTDVARALVDALGNVTVHSYHWSMAHTAEENPYFGYLALADILVVSGESASMLAEASATGKPVLIYPLDKRGKDTHRLKFLFGQEVSEWVMRQAFARPLNRRGRERPQAGLQRWCARLAAGGWVRPYGDITKLHEALIAQGIAKYFDGDLPSGPVEPLDEAAAVAAKVKALVGL